MAIVHIENREQFQKEVLESKLPVLVDFFATWCGPCKMIAPIVEEIAAERSDLVVGKIDVDSEMELAMRFGIVSIPTLIVMKGGQVAGKLVGYRPREDIEKLIDG